MIKIQAVRVLLIVLVTVCAPGQAYAGVDIGIGFFGVFPQGNGALDLGGDLQAGYSAPVSDAWYGGGELHLLYGITTRNDVKADREEAAQYPDEYTGDESLYFRSLAWYVTARPRSEWFKWMQFRGGLVLGSYETINRDYTGLGIGGGAGIVVPLGEAVQVHMLDYNYYYLGGHGFHVITISIGVLLYGGLHS